MFNDNLNILESKVDNLINVNKKLKEENLYLKKQLSQNGSSAVDIKSEDIQKIESIDGEKEKLIRDKVQNVLKKIEKLEPLI